MRSKSEEKKQTLIDAVNAYWRQHRKSPSLAELQRLTGISKTMVYRYLLEMREEGRIFYSAQNGVETNHTRRFVKTALQQVPVVGQIACGAPIFADENVEEYIELPESLMGNGEFFLLRAEGDSMIGIGISDGDLVLVRKQDVAEPGQIIVALIGDEATLKRYYPEPENKRVRLHPENSAYHDIYTDDCWIQGVGVKIIKELQ